MGSPRDSGRRAKPGARTLEARPAGRRYRGAGRDGHHSRALRARFAAVRGLPEPEGIRWRSRRTRGAEAPRCGRLAVLARLLSVSGSWRRSRERPHLRPHSFALLDGSERGRSGSGAALVATCATGGLPLARLPGVLPRDGCEILGTRAGAIGSGNVARLPLSPSTRRGLRAGAGRCDTLLTRCAALVPGGLRYRSRPQAEDTADGAACQGPGRVDRGPFWRRSRSATWGHGWQRTSPCGRRRPAT